MKLDYGDYYILDLNGKMMDAHIDPGSNLSQSAPPGRSSAINAIWSLSFPSPVTVELSSSFSASAPAM